MSLYNKRKTDRHGKSMNDAQRLLAETPDLDTVIIWKPAVTQEGKSIYVVVGRKQGGVGYTETWTVA